MIASGLIQSIQASFSHGGQGAAMRRTVCRQETSYLAFTSFGSFQNRLAPWPAYEGKTRQVYSLTRQAAEYEP